MILAMSNVCVQGKKRRCAVSILDNRLHVSAVTYCFNFDPPLHLIMQVN